MTDRRDGGLWQRWSVIGADLRRVRSEKGLTMGQVARMMGISVVLVSDYERGKRDPLPLVRFWVGDWEVRAEEPRAHDTGLAIEYNYLLGRHLVVARDGTQFASGTTREAAEAALRLSQRQPGPPGVPGITAPRVDSERRP